MSTSEPTTTRPHAQHAVISLWSAIAIGLSACGGGGGGGGGGETVTVAPPAAVVPAPAPVVPITPTPAPVPTVQKIRLMVGDDATPGNLDGAPAAARFTTAYAAYRTVTGDYWVRDYQSWRKVSATGDVTTVESPFPITYSGFPQVCVDSQGSMIYGGGERLFKMTFSGTVTEQTLNFVSGTAFTTFPVLNTCASDTQGNFWILDQGSLRKIAANGTVTTVAGSKGVFGSTDGQGSAASLMNGSSGMAADSKGNIYIADFAVHTVRKVTPAGLVTTYAGKIYQGGHVDGDGSVSRLGMPEFLFIDSADNLIVSEQVGWLRKISPQGYVTTLSTPGGRLGMVSSNGKGGFIIPRGSQLLEVDADGATWVLAGPGAGRLFTASTGNTTTIYSISATQNGDLLTFDSNNNLSQWSSSGGSSAWVSSSNLNLPVAAMASNADDNIFLLTNGYPDPRPFALGFIGSQVWQTSASGTFSKIWSDDTVHPWKISTDYLGNIYIVVFDQLGTKLIKIDKGTWKVTQTPTSLTFPTARGVIAIDANGNVYFAGNGAIWVISSATGQTTLLAGSKNGEIGTRDGQGSQARFGTDLYGIAADAKGNVWVSDTDTVRKIDTTGNVTTVAGTAGKQGITLGGLPGTLYTPGAIAVNPRGGVYVKSGDAVLSISPP